MTGRRLVAEPIRAWKHAGITWDSTQTVGPRFWPYSAYGTYGVDEVAECRPIGRVTPVRHQTRYEDHVAPHPDCKCGFYATKEPRYRLGTGLAALEVALSGTVIVHERGYRAQRQQVIGVRFPATCACGDDPEGLGQTFTPLLAPVCALCSRDELVQPSDLAGALGVGVAYDDRWTWPYGDDVLTSMFPVHVTTHVTAFSQAMTRAAASIGLTAQDIAIAFSAPTSAPDLARDIEAPDESNAYPLERTPRHVLARRRGLRQVTRSRIPKVIDPRTNRGW